MTIKGGKLMVFVAGNSIACATSHTLSINASTTDVSSTATKDNLTDGLWQESTVSGFDWSMSSDNLFTIGGSGKEFSDLFDMMISHTPVRVVFGTAVDWSTTKTVDNTGWVNDTSDVIYEGNAIITSLEINADVSDVATYSVTFTGTGALTKSEEDGE